MPFFCGNIGNAGNKKLHIYNNGLTCSKNRIYCIYRFDGVYDMFNGMLCPVHQNQVERIVDNDFRALVEEHQEGSQENLANIGTDDSIIELLAARIRHWLFPA